MKILCVHIKFSKRRYSIGKIILGEKLSLDDFVKIARHNYEVDFSSEYIKRVNDARAVIEKWVDEEKIVYGVTTGFGSNHTKTVSKEETQLLQKNIILSHSTSIGEPMSVEQCRATMLMVLQNIRQLVHSGRILELTQEITGVMK